MKQLLLICTSVLSFLTSYSQKGYSIEYLYKLQNDSYNILDTFQDTVILKTQVGKQFPSSNLFTLQPTICVSKLSTGKLLSTHYAQLVDTFDIIFSSGDAVKNHKGNYTMYGQYNSSLGSFFVEMNKYGKLIKNIHFPKPDSLGFNVTHLIQHSSQHYFFYGSIYRESNMNRDLFLMKLDTGGKIIWFKTYNDDYTIDVPIGITELKNKNILVSSSRYLTVDCRNHKWDLAVLTEIDSAGRIVKKYEDTVRKSAIQEVLEVENKVHIIGAMVLDSIDCSLPPSNEVYYSHQEIYKLDSNFKQVWAIKFPIHMYHKRIRKIKRLSDGNFLAVGYVFDTSLLKKGIQSAVMIKFTGNGQLIWKKNYMKSIVDTSNANEFRDFIELPGGDIFLTGNITNYQGVKDSFHFKRIWVMRTDRLGFLDTPIKNKLINPVLNNGSSLYPNPSNGYIRFGRTVYTGLNKAKLDVFDLLGKKVLSIGIDKENVYDVKALINGLYLARVIDINGEVLHQERLRIEKE